MTQLFIKQRSTNRWIEAVLPSNFTFKLTVENTYFTRSGEYSGEISLPLSGCSNNIRLFGFLNRLDANRRNATFDARLVVGNRNLLIGTATVLECNEASVKIQLLGSGAAANFYSKSRDLYIDEMVTLGSVFSGISFPPCSRDKYNNPGTINMFKGYITTIEADTYSRDIETDIDSVFGTVENGFVLLPAMDEDGNVVNRRIAVKWQGPNSSRFIKRLVPHTGFVSTFWRVDGTTYGNCDFDFSRLFGEWPDKDSLGYVDGRLCPQPFIDTIIRRLVAALGYTVKKDDIATGPFKKCYLPNTSETTLIMNMLPHWKVGDFLTEVENFFGVVFLFDEPKKTCSIVNKKDYFSGVSSFLKFVDDRFTTTFDDENYVDMSASNVSFDMDDGRNKLPPSILNSVSVYEARSMSDVNDILKENIVWDPASGGTENLGASRIARYNGRLFCVWDGRIVECDQLKDYIATDSEESIDLKMRPAEMGASDICAVIRKPSYYNSAGGFFGDEIYDYYTMLGWMTGTDWVSPADDNVNMSPSTFPTPICPKFYDSVPITSVQEAIESGTSDKSKEDFLPVALYAETMHNFDLKIDGQNVIHTNFNLPWPFTYGSDDVSDCSLPDQAVGLRLVPINGMTTLYDQSINVGTRIDGTAITKVTVYDEEIPPLNRLVVFNGKQYAFQKTEYTVTNDGLMLSKDCYFYATR